MNKLRQPMRRHGRLGLPLVIGLLLSGGLMAADYLPDGADGGFIRLRDAECENATALTVVLHPAGVAADRAPLSPRLVIPRRESGGWVVYVGGWPPGLEGACDLELRCTPDGAVIRLPAALARTPRRMDVALLLDDSHSMRTTDPQRLRVAAARLFAQMAAARGDIRTLSLIAFNQRARLLLPPTPPGDSEAVETALGQLEAAGATDLDRAFALAAAQFETLPPSRKVAIVLSDGRDEPGAYTFGHRRFSAHRWPVHTIGLSEAIDEATLRMIAASTGGSYHRAGNTAALARIFHEIASALHTSVKIGEWTIDDRTTHPLPVDDSISVLSLALLDTSDAAASCSLRSPDGLSRALSTIWAPDAFADIFAPAAGTWHASGSSPGARLAVSASSSLDVVPFPLPARAAADAPLPVAVFVRHQDALLHPDRVDVRLSGGPPLPLRDDGMSADGDADDGIFGGYIPLDGRARARLAFEAAGTTAAGHRYQRLAYREVITQSAGETAPLLDRTIPPAQPAMGAAERLPATSLRRHASPGISTTRLQERVRGKSHDDGSAGPGIVALEPAHAPLPPASAPAAGPLLPMELTLLPVPGASDTTLSRYNAAAIITLLLAILLLLWLITRWTARPRLQPGGLAPFLLASLLLHVLLGILVMDFFIHTRIITAEQISPALAVRLEAVEASLGIALTPPGPAVPLREQASDAVLAKASLEPAAAPTHVPEPPLARPDTHAATETDHAPIPDPATPPPPDPVPLDDVLARTAVKAPAIPQAPAAAAEAVALDAPEPAGGDAAPAQEAPAPLTVARVVPSTTAPTATPEAPVTGRPRRQEGQPAATAASLPATAQAEAPPRARPVALDAPARTAAQPPALPQAPAAAAEAVALDAPEPAGADAAPAQEAPVPLTVARVVPGTTVPAATPEAPVTGRPRRQEGQPAATAASLPATAQAEAPPRAQPVALDAPARTVAQPPTLPQAPAAAAEAVALDAPEPAGADAAPAQEAPAPFTVARVAPGTTVPAATPEAPVTGRPRRREGPPAATVPNLPATAQAEAPPRARPVALDAPDRAAAQTPALPQAPAAAAEAVALEAPEPARGDAAPAQEAPAPLTVARVVPGTTAPAATPEAPVTGRPRRREGPPAATMASLPATAQTEAPPRARPVALEAPARAAAQTPALPQAPAAAAEAVALDVPEPAGGDAAPAQEAPAPFTVARAVPGASSPTAAPASLPRAAPLANAQEPTVRSVRPSATEQTPSVPPATLQLIEPNALAFSFGQGGEGTRQIKIGLAQYGGDWDWARHAMTFLSHQMGERTRLAIVASDRIVALDSPDLATLPFVYMTGHKDFRLSDREVANLRAYLTGGGYLWADDSTHFQDDTFDTAFRRELARIFPDAPLERLGMDFEAFRTGYDLTRGFKGYAIPPGDKYRLDYIEGARVNGRVAVVYTRNDYGDGLNIDAHTHPLHASLTDLSPAEMQEGAIRMGMNLTLYFLTHGRRDAVFMDHTATTLRQQPEATAAAIPAGVARALPLFAEKASWQHEPWSDRGMLEASDAGAELTFETGAQNKCVFSQSQEPPIELTARDVLTIQVHSRLRGGARLALAFTVDGRYFESRPVFIKPGANLACFPCGEASFKTEAGGWAYRDPLPVAARIERLSLLIYSPAPGSVRLSQPRVIRQD